MAVRMFEPTSEVNRETYRRLMRYLASLARVNAKARRPVPWLIAEHDIVMAIWPDAKRRDRTALGVIKGWGLLMEILGGDEPLESRYSLTAIRCASVKDVDRLTEALRLN
jgi:hypothetical protein